MITRGKTPKLLEAGGKKGPPDKARTGRALPDINEETSGHLVRNGEGFGGVRNAMGTGDEGCAEPTGAGLMKG